MTKAPIFSETERVALLNELVKRGEVSKPDGAIAYMQVLIYKNTAQNFFTYYCTRRFHLFYQSKCLA